MSRFLVFLSFIHLAILGGIIYYCATYDYALPLKVDNAALEQRANPANDTSVATPVAPSKPMLINTRGKNVEPVATNANNIDQELDKELRKQEKLAEKAINKVKRPKSSKVATLPNARFKARNHQQAAKMDNNPEENAAADTPSDAKVSDDSGDDKIAIKDDPEQQGDSDETAEQAGTKGQKLDKEADAANVYDQVQLAALREELKDAKTLSQKQDILGKLRALNASAEEREKAEEHNRQMLAASQPAAQSAPVVSQQKPVPSAPAQTAATETHAKPNANEVRPVADLKQIAGNPIPQYDNDDRTNGREGTVIFQAFVTKAGNPQEFDLVQSSGHRSLDAKSLKAIKNWKFATNQEGWVQIPVRWSLNNTETSPELRKAAQPN